MRLIDADNIENFAHETTYGTGETILDWIHQVFKDTVFIEENEEQLTELCWKALDGCMNVIKTEPTACAWIPVYERLPDTEERVMCCTETKKGNKNITIGYYMDGAWRCGMNSNVIAWRPLPEPYKAGEQ